MQKEVSVPLLMLALVMGSVSVQAQDAIKICDDGINHASIYVVYAQEHPSRYRDMNLSLYYGLMSIDIASAGRDRKIPKAPAYPALKTHWAELNHATDTPTRGNIAYKMVADWLSIKMWLLKK